MEKVLVEYGMNVYGKNMYIGMNKATMGMDDLNALQDILMKAEKEWKEYNAAKGK